VTDQINKKELTVEWCPTGDMIGGYMTKLTQGALFRKFRDQIMGVIPTQDSGPGKAKKKMPLTTMRAKKRKDKPLQEKRVRLVLPSRKGRRQTHRSVLGYDVGKTRKLSTE
jgi:hypothetical protein